MIIRQLNSFGNYWSYAINVIPLTNLGSLELRGDYSSTSSFSLAETSLPKATPTQCKELNKRMIENKIKWKDAIITLECNANLIEAWVGLNIEPKWSLQILVWKGSPFKAKKTTEVKWISQCYSDQAIVTAISSTRGFRELIFCEVT